MPGSPTAVVAPGLHVFAGIDVPWLVDEQAALRPDARFVVWESFAGLPETWTYERFALETRSFAVGLASRGICAGDFVAIHLDNCPEFLIAWVACSRIGAIAVTTSTQSTAPELAYLIRHCRAKFAVTQPCHAALVREAAPQLEWIACLRSDLQSKRDDIDSADLVPFEELRGDAQAWQVRPPDPQLPNNVIFTSGTTARPKGVVWTHANALWVASTTAVRYQLGPNDATPVYLPLFHTNALGLSVLATLWSGGCVILQPRFSVSRFWTIAQEHGCTWAQMLWFTLRALATQRDTASHSFRFWAAAGDMTLVRERWGIRTLGIYGLTETVGLCVASEPGFPGPEGSMGRPRAEYEIAIRREDGSGAATDEAGRVWVRGRRGLSLFSEYLNDPVATSAAFDDNGWFDTGDLAVTRPDGHLFFVGRAKDMLRVGGENVAALEIEAVIARVPGVIECAVIGQADSMLDEVPVAFVVASESAGPNLVQDIESACVSALAAFKRPREVYFIETLPKGLLDKVLKTELRARLEAMQRLNRGE